MSNLIIASIAYNRPDYLKKSLASIFAMDGLTNDIKVVGFVDILPDGKPNQEVLNIYNQYSIPVQVAPTKMGCNMNIKRALSTCFADGADAVLVVEDDIVVAPDALNYIKWALENFGDNPMVRNIALWESIPPGLNPSEIRFQKHKFSCWGWVALKREWEAMEKAWTTDKSDSNLLSWDVVMEQYFGDRFEICPAVSRATNIGHLGGIHRNGEMPNMMATEVSYPYFINTEKRKKVLVCLGRNGDNYMVCKAATEPSIVFTSADFAPIVRELFPQHELFVLNKKISGLAEAMQYAKSRYPDHQIFPCQQHGMPREVQMEFRNYEEYQKWQAK